MSYIEDGIKEYIEEKNAEEAKQQKAANAQSDDVSYKSKIRQLTDKIKMPSLTNFGKFK